MSIGDGPVGFTVGRDDGEPIELPSWRMRVTVPARSTRGAFTVIHGVMAPRLDGPRAHVHDGHDEAFYVLSGLMRFRLGDREQEVGPGGMAFASRGLAHRFANAGDEPATYLVVVAPSGYEDYFREVEAHVAETGATPDLELTRQLMSKYATRLA